MRNIFFIERDELFIIDDKQKRICSFTTLYFIIINWQRQNNFEEQKNTTIKTTDVLGKEIKTINFFGKQCIIEKGEMSNGIYFVQITNGTTVGALNGNVVNRKIMIERQ